MEVEVDLRDPQNAENAGIITTTIITEDPMNTITENRMCHRQHFQYRHRRRNHQHPQQLR